jgi:peptidyl-prolyl cis-trans isomerase A (cyclophilin A)
MLSAKMTRKELFTAAAVAMLILGGCSSPTTETKKAEAPKTAAPAAPKDDASQIYKVRFETTKGPFVVEVHRDWAPLGAARFEELVKAGYFDNSSFFRVVPNFIIQFGLAANPAMSKKWDKTIKDDTPSRTNGLGTISFATMGPETRTTQVFINLRSNQSLDAQGFAPFGRVIEGMDVVTKLYAGHGEGPDQQKIMRQGNAYLKASFPRLDYIKTAKIE